MPFENKIRKKVKMWSRKAGIPGHWFPERPVTENRNGWSLMTGFGGLLRPD